MAHEHEGNMKNEFEAEDTTMTPTMEEVAGWLREHAEHFRLIGEGLIEGRALCAYAAQSDSRAAQVEATGWRTIEEAPRTGEEVDLWDDFAQSRITDCKWMKNAWHRWEPNSFETMDWCRVHGKLSHFMCKPQPPCNLGKN